MYYVFPLFFVILFQLQNIINNKSSHNDFFFILITIVYFFHYNDKPMQHCNTNLDIKQNIIRFYFIDV